MHSIKTSPRSAPPATAEAPSTSLHYSPAQRWTALAIGVVCHSLFVSSVVVMFISLYTGLTSGLLELHGWPSLLVNTLLLVQFGLLHSVLLSDGGRRWMMKLAPLGLGKALSTTLFATIASAQLLLVFLLWCPSHVLWAAPHGWIKGVMSAAYGVSWVLLAKSMHDAGMGVQVGSVGWLSVWQNKKPVYGSFSRSGTFKHVRQPIYLSFSLILWTAPVWTPDHLFAAILWTGYCVFAPILKEKRYRRFYGEAFATYQKSVPYWLPKWKRKTVDEVSVAAAPPPRQT